MPAILPNLIPIPPSLQGTAAVKIPLEAPLEVPLEITPEVLIEAPLPILTIDWEQIKTFRKKL